MRALQQESQETRGQEGLILVTLNHTFTVLWQRTAQGTNTHSSPKSIFPTGTISLWLTVLISWLLCSHWSRAAVIATWGRGAAVPGASDCTALRRGGFQRSSSPSFPREQGLYSWQTGWSFPPRGFPDTVPGACWSPLEPGEMRSSLGIHPCNHLGSGSASDWCATGLEEGRLFLCLIIK